MWNPAAGTGSLTRGHSFKNLLCSTLEEGDLPGLQQQHPESLVFQYDFLRPELPTLFFEEEINAIPAKAVALLQEVAKAGMPLVWLMNPPYGTANNREKGAPKTGVADTPINCTMKTAGLGSCAPQLYTQFMFRAAQITRDLGFQRSFVALFSRPSFACSTSYRSFRRWWYSRFRFETGFLFQASHFAGVSDRWGISFTLWESPGSTEDPDLRLALKDISEGTVIKTGVKLLYQSDDQNATHWTKSAPVAGLEAPTMSSGLKVKSSGQGCQPPSAFGSLVSVTNSQITSIEGFFLLSSCPSMSKGIPIFHSNFRRIIALYTARKLHPRSWETATDEYLIPDTTLPGYEQWVDDGHVFVVADSVYNNCTAMRNVRHKNKIWTIHNHFFWRRHAHTLQTLDTSTTPTLHQDCWLHPSKDVFGHDLDTTPDPYLASVLPRLSLSREALLVLTKLDALWQLSLPQRESYASKHPELHLTSWDAGTYQLKRLWKELFPTEWAELQDAFKMLSNKLRPGVYTYGFLRK